MKQQILMSSTHIQKHDIEANWVKALHFTPAQGQLIIYDDRYVDEKGETIIVADKVRYKIGDGQTLVNDLPFMNPEDTDIKLGEQFIITKDFGYYKLDGAASKKVGTIGQSLHEFLQGALAEEDKTIFDTTPSCTISMSGGSAEIGSTITPSASWSTNAGTYKWGTYNNGADYNNKVTGITYTDTNGNSLGAEDITIDKISFVIGSTSEVVTASGNAKRSAVTNYPCSNLGSNLENNLSNEYKTEKTLSPTKTATFTSYRRGFYGTLETKEDNIDSALVRSLANKTTSNPAAGKDWVLNIPKKAIRIVFAYPATLRDVNKVIDAATKYDVKTSFTKYIINVEGASAGYAASYKVYVSDFAKGNEEANTYTITI